MFTTHASLLFDIPDTDCWTQNGSTYGCVLATFKAWILNKEDDKQSEQLLCVFYYILWTGPVILLFWFGSPLNGQLTVHNKQRWTK